MSKTAKAPIPADIAALSFEDAVKQLEDIVKKLESGQQDLDSAITHYTRGNHLREHCEAKLKEAKLKVEKILSHDGKATATEPFEAE